MKGLIVWMVVIAVMATVGVVALESVLAPIFHSVDVGLAGA